MCNKDYLVHNLNNKKYSLLTRAKFKSGGEKKNYTYHKNELPMSVKT
jgi:hypothetical protein